MDSEKHLDLGSWTSLQNAFAAVAGSCSAARAQCLKQVRDSRILDDLRLAREEYRTEYAGISRGHADELIRQYIQFGSTPNSPTRATAPPCLSVYSLNKFRNVARQLGAAA